MLMKVTKTAKREALKRAAEAFGKEWLKPIAPYLDPIELGETMEVHSIQDWIIARAEPNMEATAVVSLERNGFECWYPSGKFVRTLALRHLPSKTRHKRSRQQVQETQRPAYPGYLFVRHMFGCYDVNRLYDLTGVAGVCCFGEVVATVRDLEIEVMRLKAASGAFDRFSSTAAEHLYRYHLSKDFKPGVDKQYVGETTVMGRSCESGGLVTFQKTLDRITRVITAPAPSEATQ